ncbi:hypothetical protein IHE44_0001378 [Lamprotornis superbus]|uniref:Receptor-type tyrosine-protein phosphatase epsilon n=1 Tax=Lamprotornis superbus TaxID=245042 RepID=A0A835NP61_9PASS|nr:hypothetical protein IHE44_0001378 [Lamprotornis superbus]
MELQEKENSCNQPNWKWEQLLVPGIPAKKELLCQLTCSRSRMEHSCSLLLLCVSFVFAQALPPNGTELPKTTTTTNSTEENTLHKELLTSLLILVLVVIIFVVLVGYFFRFRRHRKAVVNSGDKKMPNGILEEQVINVWGTFEMANKEENREKNRYPNILPYDHSRVILTQIDGVPASDYINASYIDGYKEKNKFIAAQGPKQETVNDFWRMIWEQKSAIIVMLTNLKERKEGCWTYGSVRVSVEDCIVLVDYTIRKFCVHSLHEGCKAPRLVTQLHFTSWPDFGVPFTPIGMLKFLKKVKTLNPAHAGPIVVHCSAGVGRTGTFIVIDAIMDMMHAEHRVDVFDFVSRIRNQRPQMVQTDYYLYGDTELDVSSLEKHLQTSQNAAPNLVKIGLEEEFKENMRTGNLPANMKKARVIQIIPYDFNRVILSMKRGQEYTDYINASFIDGYRQKDYFIATQGPLPHTVEDFWRMVWEWKCHTIVMLTEVQEREQEKCCQYWPSEGSVTHGDITVEIKSDSLMDAISVRDFLVTYNQNNQEKQSRLVRQFHFHGWPEIGIPAEGKGMIDLIAAVQKQQQQTGNHPITVHCSAGAGRTGTFIALSNILERVKAEGLLDVFQAVKSLRLQRPHMVQTLEQYEFCYRVVQDFIDIFSDYANFK